MEIYVHSSDAGQGGRAKRCSAQLLLRRKHASLDERQITHLICARLKYMIDMTFLGGVWGPFIQEKEQEAGPKHG